MGVCAGGRLVQSVHRIIVVRFRRQLICTAFGDLYRFQHVPLPHSSSPPTHTHTHTLQVLSVDDDPVNQMVVQAMLSKAGFKVLQAPDGQKALDMLEVRMGCRTA